LTSQPIFLLELMSLQHGDVVTADVCAHLDCAVEKAIHHVKALSLGEPLHSHVTTDGEIFEGMSLFDSRGNMLACVTSYHLDRDHERAQCPVVRNACADFSRLQAALSEIINP